MLNLERIRAISLDLDDTLWPIWPTIEHAERVLREWLAAHAPMTAALYANPGALREIRNEMERLRPDLHNDLSALRRESIRLALYRAGEDPLLAEAAFEVFFDARHHVTFYPDVLPALEFLAARYPLVALSNGNAQLHRVGLDHFFQAAINAREFGVGKPDPRIFHAAAGAVDLTPHEVLHVGDDTLLDVLGAQNAGMQAAWANRKEALWPHEDQAPEIEVYGFNELCDALR
ncbi:HAD family hydrolase [Ramlibacter sp. MAHUQ-53]|uniref:HAD family hydrolase n=1 Tax=unclassified Ramlibacter TaxID=2617605 RepID=UPI003629A588